MKPRLDDANSLPDLLTQDDFMFCIAALPGAGSGRELWLKCQEVTLPGVNQKPVETKMFGHTRRDRGAAEFSPEFTATFLEDAGSGTYRQLFNWLNYTVHLPTGNSVANKSGYTTSGVIIIHDTTGAPALQMAILGLQITGIQDVQLSVQSQGMLQISATFTFDSMALDYGSGAAGILGYLLGGGSADGLLSRLSSQAVNFFSGAAIGAAQGFVTDLTGSAGLGSLAGSLGGGLLNNVSRRLF